MSPTERKIRLERVLEELEALLIREFKARCNFVLVITEGDEPYVTSVTNTPKELATHMIRSTYGRPYVPSSEGEQQV